MLRPVYAAKADMPPLLLVVDDEKDMLDFVERVFRRDFEVVRCGSVDEAELILFKQGREFEVVITDRRMPKRGGFELLEICAAKSPHTLRVLLTGYADSMADEKVSQWKLVDAWISKPIDSAALRKAVEDNLPKARARRVSAPPAAGR
jgi:DNA-binding NtrC family response regulator